MRLPYSAEYAYEVFDRAGILPQHNGRVVVGRLPFRLGVYSSKIQLLPHLLEQFIDVPAVLGADGARVRDAIDQVQFLNGDGVNLVQSVYHWDVASTLGLQDINQIIDGGITPNGDVSRRDLILAHYCLDFLQTVSDARVEHCGGTDIMVDVR